MKDRDANRIKHKKYEKSILIAYYDIGSNFIQPEFLYTQIDFVQFTLSIGELCASFVRSCVCVCLLLKLYLANFLGRRNFRRL